MSLLKKPANLAALLVSGGLYACLFYGIERHETLPLLATYTLLFGAYLYLLHQPWQHHLRLLVALGLALRLIPLLAWPALSDDFYRFVWDGRLWAAGINPFAGLPTAFVHNEQLAPYGISRHLLSLLNSPDHYTVYPAIPQYINLLAGRLFPHNILYAVILMRSFIIAAEVVSLGLMVRLLQRAGGNPAAAALYAFNPLVIIELSGNLHHEALIVVFLLAFFYAWQRGNQMQAAGWLGLSVAAKLLPLMFLPLVLLKARNRMVFGFTFSAVLLLVFLPLLDASFLAGMQDSLTLYYQHFEFNAGLYYLLRQVGYWLYGYNTIAVTGKLLLVLSAAGIAAFTWWAYRQQTELGAAFSLLYLIYALGSPILHPWYVLLPVALAPFTGWRWPLVWSFAAFFTYAGYNQTGFSENYWIVAGEYLALLAVLVSDLKFRLRESVL